MKRIAQLLEKEAEKKRNKHLAAALARAHKKAKGNKELERILGIKDVDL